MIKTIYFAGGCFWGLEKYFNKIMGIHKCEVGYANGITKNPTYINLEQSLHAETVKVDYDPEIISLMFLLDLFYEVIDPTSYHRQGNDIGTQYRTGVYFVDLKDKKIIDTSLKSLQKKYHKKIVIECKALENYYPAEAYHQKYLDKNPSGYCHIGLDAFQKASNIKVDPYKYKKPSDEVLKKKLSSQAYAVTQQNITEKPFSNEYDNHFEKGIYVDVTTGEPLFLSQDKFTSTCGWPDFSNPIDDRVLNKKEDTTFGMQRIEIRSRVGNAHLGHVFNDGPEISGGLRYCINSSAMKFIAYKDLEKEGYGYLQILFHE